MRVSAAPWHTAASMDVLPFAVGELVEAEAIVGGECWSADASLAFKRRRSQQ